MGIHYPENCVLLYVLWRVYLYFNQTIFTPLKIGEDTIGILAVTGPDLSSADNPAIAAFANQAAIAIQNASLYERAQQEITKCSKAETALAASE